MKTRKEIILITLKALRPILKKRHVDGVTILSAFEDECCVFVKSLNRFADPELADAWQEAMDIALGITE